MITSFARGASEAEWSPDGKRLAVIGAEWLESGIDDDERKRRPRRIRGAGFRFDNLGWLHDRRKNVYLVEPAGGAPVALTSGEDRDGNVVWRPDGTAVAFLTGWLVLAFTRLRMAPRWDGGRLSQSPPRPPIRRAGRPGVGGPGRWW